ncbi:hypothetical protein Tdes44962_MAKER10043 [Teratosphaeria destructans]|uniref:Uncharacterized protein n=1 Tax=Teratosphaeria destructans TaxID=418781 RepID=A0A9W7SPS0_9PEZI|nr:hypothetical protein Tdes44962_MAKER10043 [Teratosphaeria destructans]
MLLLVLGAQGALEFLYARQLEQFFVGGRDVLVDDDMSLEDAADVFFADATRAVVGRLEFADVGPEVDLRRVVLAWCRDRVVGAPLGVETDAHDRPAHR